jgi:DNA-binding MarR family transcriptional regulator/N-acetylglutamate synthase-like GNAT family acetyltransferase
MADANVAAVRRFSRFYTRKIGIVDESFLQSPYSLAEVRLMYEIAHRDEVTATDLADDLRLDPGYLSRVLRRLQTAGLIDRKACSSDGRRRLLKLSDAGERVFAELDIRQDEHVAKFLADVPDARKTRLTKALAEVETILDNRPRDRPRVVLRNHRPGDMGWVVHRHGVLYAQEYGYDQRFEALVARIVCEFIEQHDPKRERCWIAEQEGRIAGSVFLSSLSDEAAKLRLLYVEPWARGFGLGRRLIDECIRFAKDAGYTKLVLWTQADLQAARHLYREAGFKLVSEKPHRRFAERELIAETWERGL